MEYLADTHNKSIKNENLYALYTFRKAEILYICLCEISQKDSL